MSWKACVKDGESACIKNGLPHMTHEFTIVKDPPPKRTLQSTCFAQFSTLKWTHTIFPGFQVVILRISVNSRGGEAGQFVSFGASPFNFSTNSQANVR